MDDFVEGAYEEIDEEKRKEILANDKVLTALRSRSGRIGKLTYGDFTIQFRLSISRKLRKELYRAKESSNIEGALYRTIAAMCIESPWNDWQTWAVYDESIEDGGVGVLEILQDMMKEVGEFTNSVSNFR